MDELENIKRLAGITGYKQVTEFNINQGSNISLTGNEKGKLMKEKNIRPGTDEWFKLWHSRPYLTNEKPI